LFITSPSHTSKYAILSAEANWLEASGFNLMMDNKNLQKTENYNI
jgi:hypothetical protein